MARERGKDDIAYAIIPFKLITWPIGVWPLQVYDIYSLLRCVLSTCCVSLVVILPSMELYMGCTDVGQKIDCLMLICCGILGVLKMTWFRVYPNSLIINYNSALNDYLTIENTKERDIMRRHAFIGRILCFSLLAGAYIGGLAYAIIPFVNYAKGNQINITNEDVILEYALPSRCALEYFNFPISMYKISCLIQMIVLILAPTTNFDNSNDALFLNIILHVCGQVNILRNRFIKFDVTSSRIDNRFNELIQRHRHVIMLARELADLISFVLLIELFIISILLCIMGFQLIFALKVHDTVMISRSSFILSVFLIQLTLYSFIGNYLKSEMEEIGHSIYQSVWYNFPRKLIKSVIFVLMQTQSPVALQAGNFIVINLSTYVTILKTSFSYLSLLRIMLGV
ncbi:odorant receptor 13a-like [Camponotus floridanus]|uniref:odorant receptor 13a-like n=1 Tax=Camponotus floridanus TaxID=104421 RepID=UPI000DC687AB|nr:odorant receptor 13a-like [Camponotus floridanus]